MAASSIGIARFTIHVPADFTWPYQRLAIAADVTVDGRQLGQITEAVVDVTRTGRPGRLRHGDARRQQLVPVMATPRAA